MTATSALCDNERPLLAHPGIGERHKATPSQIALAWLLARKPWIVPLFGTRKLERFEENIGALSVRLTADDMRELNESMTAMPVQGNRYPDEHMRRVGP